LDGNKLTAAASGTVTIRAVIENGKAATITAVNDDDSVDADDYVQLFTITFNDAPRWGISLDKTEYDFAYRSSGLTVTVSNSGNQPTGTLSIGLFGTDSPPVFVLSKNTINSLPANGTDSFDVSVNVAAAAVERTYTALIMVDPASGNPNSFTGQRITVAYTPPTYGIELQLGGVAVPQEVDFGTAIYGYSQPASQIITVEDTGNQPTGDLTVALSGTGADSFQLSKTFISSFTRGANASFEVSPQTGLPAGTYTALVTVSGESVERHCNVRFSVTSNSGVTVVLWDDVADTEILDGAVIQCKLNETRTISVKQNGYTAYQWDLNGSREAAFDGQSSYIFDGNYKGAGKNYTVSVRVQKDGVWYSASVLVKMTE
jgi:predicted secreted protein